MISQKSQLGRLLAASMLAITLMGCAGASAPAPTTQTSTEQQNQLAIHVKIDSTVAGGGVEEFDLEAPEGANAYDTLVLGNIDHELVQSDWGPYVSAIGGIAENANDTTGGWTYTVNDKMPDVGASDYLLQDGDQVVWEYVTF